MMNHRAFEMKIKTLLIVFCIFATVFPQEYSVHKEHSERYGIKENLPSEFDTRGNDIIPLQFDKAKKTGTIIYGYLPDWEYPTAKAYLRYDILTHIAAFDFVVSSTGAITNPSGWPWTDVINTAHLNGVKVTLSAVNFTGNDIHTIMTDATVKQTFFNNVKSRIQQYQLDGVNIDFESLNTADRGTVLNTFMAELKTFMNANFPGKEVSFAGPAITSSGWNVAGLANSCDFIFIMGYAFWGSWSTTSGACAPLTGGTYNITNTVLTQYSTVTNTNPQKLVLGVPYYGLKWTTQTQNAHSTVINYISSTRFKDDVTLAQQYGLLWASDNQVPWYRYQSGTTWYQVWYDNDSSLGMKYALAQSKNLAGVGMWALGYDGSRNELWNELYKRFYLQIPVELTSFNAENNYPAVSIRWQTSTETNNRLFYVSRGVDGSGSDKVVGRVDGYGSSASPRNYMLLDEVSQPGLYKYKLHQVDYNGTEKIIAEKTIYLGESVPATYIDQNFPNPAVTSTSFKYKLAEDSRVLFQLFNSMGEKIAVLADENREAGEYEIKFNTENLSSGIYFYELKTGNSRVIKKMSVLH